MSKQDEVVAKLERQGWEFSNWVPAYRPDAPEDAQTAVLTKRRGPRTEYKEVEFDGSVSF